jgi:myo-inositol 2-dehydrogenase / D-chiro-inositol 1-dehydrogenase
LGVARTPAKCLPHLVRLPVKTVALCDVDAKRLGQIGDRYGVTPRYADAAEPLADEELDAIGMAVGPALHGELGIQALSRGLPVFMEKPPAPTADAAERLADEAARPGSPTSSVS